MPKAAVWHPGKEATLEQRAAWSTPVRSFVKRYEESLQDPSDEPLSAIEFFRRFRPSSPDQLFYTWRKRRKSPGLSDHLRWLEGQHGGQDLYDRMAEVRDAIEDALPPPPPPEEPPIPALAKREVFLRVLEKTFSHRDAMESSEMTWFELRDLYRKNRPWRKEYESIAGPWPDDASYFWICALDTTVRSAILESKAADAKSLLTSLLKRYDPKADKKPEEKVATPKERDQAAMTAMYLSLVQPASEAPEEVN